MISNSDNLSEARLKVVLATILLNVLAVCVFAQIPFSDWRTGMFLNLLDNAIFLVYLIKFRDELMARFLVFGLALGFSELAADAWLVDVTRTLDYTPGGGPLIWRSPLWMPFAWEVVGVQFAVLGGWLKRRFGVGGVFLTGLIGALNIPFYEEMALNTHWWAYRDCQMFLHTPFYIVLGEFLIVMAIVLLSQRLKEQNFTAVIAKGVAGGLAIFLCYAFSFWIFESLMK